VDHSDLHTEPMLCPFIVAVPDTRMVRVFWGLDVGSGGIFQSPLDGKYFGIVGDGRQELMVFPDTLATPARVPIPSILEFHEKIRANPSTDKWNWFKEAEATETADLLTLVPISAYLVYDSFDTKLDAITLYKRILGLANHQTLALVAAKQFIQDLQ